jgi:hypothetical protein
VAALLGARGLSLARAASLGLGLVASLSGCNEIASLGPEICDRTEEGNPPVPYTEGTVEAGVYMTSPWDGELLWFPGGMRYELFHGLGASPRIVQPYLSFHAQGLDPASDGVGEPSLGLAAGNQAELVAVSDESIVLKNGTCSDYWLLVVATAGEP